MNRRQRLAEERAQQRAERKLEREPKRMRFQAPPAQLAGVGPVIQTDLAVSGVHAEALIAAGQLVPSPVRCRFLIDTGAAVTLVRHEVAAQAGLKLIASNTPIHGIGVDTTGKVYLGRILFIMQSNIIDEARHFMTVDTMIRSATLPSGDIDGLIGRDVLSMFAFAYDGSVGTFELLWKGPAKPPASSPRR